MTGGQQVVTAGAAGRELAAPSGTPPGPEGTTAPAPGAAKEALPEGVLARVTPAMATAIGTVAAVAMAEAAFNLGRAVYTILQLPLPLAIGFPAIFEAAAGSFAVQDMRDRRAGHASAAMRVATYLTLVASSIVNGIVGWLAHGGTGLVEVLPPLVLAAVIHLHGDRATRAHHSQAVLRPAWRQAQLDAARRAAVLDVLPLLAGDDADGQATVALLRRWMESGTLQPGYALLAAGWHARGDRDMDASRLRRLETVAAAVWGPSGPPPAPAEPAAQVLLSGSGGASRGGPVGGSSTRPARGSSTGSTPGSAGGSATASHGSTTGSTGGSFAGSVGGSSSGSAPGKRSIQELRARSIENLIDELTAAVQAGILPAEGASAKSIREELQCSPERSRTLRAYLEEHPLGAAAPPQLTLLHAQPSASQAAAAEPDGPQTLSAAAVPQAQHSSAQPGQEAL